MVIMKRDVEIIFCETCKGNGWTEHEELTCYHKRDYRTDYKDCEKCNLTGRVIKTTTVDIEYAPFDPERPDIRATDNRPST